MRTFPRSSHAVQLFVVLVGLCSLFEAAPAFGATVSASQTKISYGNNPVNSGPWQYVTLTNRGTDTAKISWVGASGGQSAAFKVYNITAPLSLAKAQSITFMVKFIPKAVGTFTSTLSVFSTNAVRVEIPLSGSASTGSTGSTGGSGTGTKGTLTVSSTSLSFGNVTVGTTSSKTVTLTAATAAVQITNATTTNQEFTLSGLTLPATIAAGKSISVGVNFKPTASGSTSTTLSLTDNATTSPGVITATGAGIATKAHTVGLTWAPSTSTVVGYNVYRGTTTGGPYSKLNSSSVVSTSFSDTGVTSGATYFYVTTAVNSAGAESSKSNEVRAAVPTP